jgi:hypothetical protein
MPAGSHDELFQQLSARPGPGGVVADQRDDLPGQGVRPALRRDQLRQELLFGAAGPVCQGLGQRLLGG